IDLPFEFLWDILILPTQFSLQASRREGERWEIAKMMPLDLARCGYYNEFKKRVQKKSLEENSGIMANLAWAYAGEPEKFRPYVDYLFSLDHRCGGDYVLDSLNFNSETVLTSHLFELGLRPAEYPHEHAVFNAIKYICQHINGRPPEYSTLKQLERIRLLLENGCNPNSIPEYNCKYVYREMDDFDGESSLDMARRALEAFHKMGNEKEEALLKEIVLLLEKNGAKTAKELNMDRGFKWLKLNHFFEKRDFEHFRMRMGFAPRKEKEDAMWGIAYSKTPVEVFEPYCRLLRDDGIPFPSSLLLNSFPMTPQMLPFLQFAFANGLKGADYPESSAIVRLCDMVAHNVYDYDKGYIELLKLLLKNGLDPNVPLPPANKSKALHILQFWERHPREYPQAWVSVNGRRITLAEREKQGIMLREMIELVKQYGGISAYKK
ncbi:MAG: hypothetical protein IJS15_14075, partial [Victivallales bacterium]|nr:hypothetical protein [Victivallales bacterium]